MTPKGSSSKKEERKHLIVDNAQHTILLIMYFFYSFVKRASQKISNQSKHFKHFIFFFYVNIFFTLHFPLIPNHNGKLFPCFSMQNIATIRNVSGMTFLSQKYVCS